MAFLKFSRDRRGYEHFALVQPSSRGKARPRVLYWFRTPPNLKIGRAPFDPDIQRALEHQNPDIAFDWKAIVHAPVPPPPEAERWRERRRIERAMRAAAEAEPEEPVGDEAVPAVLETAAPLVEATAEVPVVEVPVVPLAVEAAGTETAIPIASSNSGGTATAESAPPRARGPRRRRRRRRQREKVQGVQGGQPVQGVQGDSEARHGPGGAENRVADGEPGEPEDGV
jgi:hypothetical protein